MAAHRHASNMFQRLIGLNHSAFAAGRYGTAYYTLAAALHEAQYGHDADGLAIVQQVAEEQLTWIDRAAPACEHSTQSAAERGQSSLFMLLIYQAHAQLLLMQQERQRASVGIGERGVCRACAH